MKNTEKLFSSLVTDNKVAAAQNFGTAIREKLNDALEIRKVGLTAKIYNTKPTTGEKDN